MRILHFLPAVAPRYGGTTTIIWPMLAALRDIGGLDVELAATDLDGPSRIAPADLPADSGKVHLLPGGRGSLPPLRKWLHGNAASYDLMHIHSLWNPYVVAACRAARKSGVPYVLSPHGMLSAYSWNRGRWRKLAYWRAFHRRDVRSAGALHATSTMEAADIRACGVNAPIHEISLGMENTAFTTPIRSGWLRERCPEAGNRPIVLFLSRIHPKKGIIDFLLPAFAALGTDAFLAIAGGADSEHAGYEAEIRQTIERLGLSGKASLMGRIPPAERWYAFDGAAVFCLPSHSENFGVVVTEAMARGCPVVASEHVDAGRIAAEARAGLVVPLSVPAIAAAIDSMLADPDARGRGREYVRQNLAWERAAALIARMYTQAAPAAVRNA